MFLANCFEIPLPVFFAPMFSTHLSPGTDTSYICILSFNFDISVHGTKFFFFFFYGATARGGPWPPLQYFSKPLDPLLYLSIRLFPSFAGP
jgi:hypothetical protein